MRPRRPAPLRAAGPRANARSARNVSLVTQPLPDQAPQRVDRALGKAAAGALVNGGEERGPLRLAGSPAPPARAGRAPPPRASRGLVQPRQPVGEVQRHPAVARAQRRDPHPDDLARRRQRVEIAGQIPLDPRRQDLALQRRRGQRHALQLLDRVEQGVEARPPLAGRHPLPARDAAGEHRRLDRLDLLAQAGQRAAADACAAPRGRTTPARCARAGRRPRPACSSAGQPVQRRLHLGRAAAPGAGPARWRRTGRGCGRSAAAARPADRPSGRRNASGRPGGSAAPSASR